jgi:flagellar biosynthetic protein FliQ
VTESLLAALKDGVALAILIAAPVLVAALIAGVLAGLLGALTQIDDPAVGLVIRVAAIAIALAIFTPAIARELADLATHLGAMIARIGAG